MANPALEGIERLKPKPKKKVAQQKKVTKEPIKVQAPVALEEPSLEDLLKQTVVVRTPRTTPTSATKKVDDFLEGAAMMDTKKNPLGVSLVTQERREWVMGWMMNGHQHGGRLMTERQLAIALDTDEMTIKADISALKDRMGQFFVDQDNTEIPALAYVLMEMKFQDRGRALSIYNEIKSDIEEADEYAAEIQRKVKNKELPFTALKGAYRLTGRDRAAMYSSALQALDLSNKATNGMDNLFKMAGGATKLQAILKAKNVQINNYNGASMNLQQLQEFASKELGVVIPSTRMLTGGETPATLDLTLEDKEVLAIGEREVGKR